MKKFIILFVLLLILFGVGIGISMVMNTKVSYHELLNPSNKDYEVNIVFSEEDIQTFYGGYDSKTNTIKLFDDEDKETVLQENLYKEMLSYLPKKTYDKEGTSSIYLLSSELKTKLPFKENLSIGTFLCEYEISDYAILSITCSKEDSKIIIDFDY